MTLTYGSVCSGIEAATQAWHPLGFRPAWFCEIEPFPSAVLAHHYPEVPNYGDFTALISKDHPRSTVDVLVGGTPCQAFSVAGLRGGLADPRGNLALAFVALVDALRPRWVVWENVPGVLSSGGGRDFGSFLGALGELGYGWSYRVLDAQYFGLAQRRKRMFVVASPGDWRRSAAVLFEPDRLRRDSPPRRETGAGVAGSVATRLGSSGQDDNAGQANQVVPAGRRDVEASQSVICFNTKEDGKDALADLSPPLRAESGDPHMGIRTAVAYNVHAAESGAKERHAYEASVARRLDSAGGFASSQGGTVIAYGGGNTSGPIDVATACLAHPQRQDFDVETFIAHTLRGNGHDASDGTGRGVPLVPVSRVVGPITASAGRRNGGASGRNTGDHFVTAQDVADTITSCFYKHGGASGGKDCLPRNHVVARVGRPERLRFGPDGFNEPGIRRLMPHELERLQGFPDHFTRIPYRGKRAEDCPDGPRAKALGNSMATTVMAWIGRRLLLVDALPR